MSDIFLSVDGDTRPLESKLNRISSKSINLNLRDGVSQPLGRITGKISEFDKSLEASNARVLAFGASAGAVYAIGRAFKEVVASTIEVEKSLADINVVLNASASGLSKFGSGLFSIAKNTGQSFGEVAKAATELARQGLGVEETLRRTSDALILTRLSGLDAAKSVETLTAAVNGFSKAGLTTTEIINKLATVDAAFAVSTADLANALSRVGSTAQDAGVSLDELIAVVTAAQQTTARGGAVIGNSLKTIFTRLQRTDTLEALEGVGIAVKDLQGNTLPALQILKNLSDVFYQLGDAQRASIAETVGGVFQINILRAALGDLSKEYSIYDSALRTSVAATNQAIKRNEALNQTLSALINKTFVNLKQAGAGVGEITIAPTIKKGAAGLNSILEAFNQPAEFQGAGTKIAKGILSGLGDYLSGPGLAVIGAVFLKIFSRLTSFSAEALKSILGMASASDKLAAAQARITSILAQNPGLIQAMISKEMSLLQVENQILQVIQAQNAARAASARVATSLGPRIVGMGGGKSGKIKSKGFVPNFSAEMQEIMGAQQGGYRPGSIKRMNIPGEGNVVYNTAESVVNFPGAKQPAIIPPRDSKAGKNYKKEFQKEAGFNPYASKGFIPNFAKIPQGMRIEDAIKKNYSRSMLSQRYGAAAVNQLLGPSRSKSPPLKEDINLGFTDRVSMIYPAKTGLGKATGAFKDPEENRYRISFNKAGFNAKTAIRPEDAQLENSLAKELINFVNNYISQLSDGKFQKVTNIKELANAGGFGSIVGTVFETAVTYATQSFKPRRGGQSALIDFPSPNKNLKELFNNAPGQYEAKANDGQDLVNDVARKIYQAGFVNTKLQKRSAVNKTKSSGFIPNFSALQDAIKREKDAGVAPSRIRIGADDSLMSRNNPLGLGVYNTKDEPAGLKQGINRSKSKGFVPNFATDRLSLPYNQNSQAVDRNAKTFDRSTISTQKSVDKEGQYQTRLFAASIALTTLQGVMNQFSDQTSESTKNMQQLTLALSNVLTGFALSKRYGGLIGGAMLGIQGSKMKEDYANKPYTQVLSGLDKEMDQLRDKTTKLDGAMASVIEQVNNYITELEKAVPDENEVQKFRSNILDAISNLPAETQKQVMAQMPKEKMFDKETPINIKNTLDKTRSDLTQQGDLKALAAALIKSQQETAAKQRDYDGMFSSALRFLGMGEKERPKNKTFEDPEVTKDTANILIGNIMSDASKKTVEGLIALSEQIVQTGEDGNALIKVLEEASPQTQETKLAFDALNSTLAEGPDKIKNFKQATLDSLTTMLEKAKQAKQDAIAGGQGRTEDKYQGISKIFKKEDMISPTGNSKQNLRLMSTSYNVDYYRQRGDTQMQGRAAGAFINELNQLGLSKDDIKSFAPDLVKDFEKGAQMDIDRTINEAIDSLKRSSPEFANDPVKQEEFRKKAQGLLTEEGRKKSLEQLSTEYFGEVEQSLSSLNTVTIEASDQLPKLTAEVTALESAIKSLREEIENTKKGGTSFDAEKGKKEGVNLPNTKNKTDEIKNSMMDAASTGLVTGTAATVGTKVVSKGAATIAKKRGKTKDLIKNLKRYKKGGRNGKITGILTAGAMFGKDLVDQYLSKEDEEENKKEIPNYAKPKIRSIMALEEMLSGKDAKLYSEPYLHVRNSSQPSYQGAIAQHGGLRKALEDSRANQNITGSIPNFAVTPGSDAFDSLRRLAEGDSPEAKAAKKKLEDILKKFKKVSSGGLDDIGRALPSFSSIDNVLSSPASALGTYSGIQTTKEITKAFKVHPMLKGKFLGRAFGGKLPVVSAGLSSFEAGSDEQFWSDELTGIEKLQRAAIASSGVGLDTFAFLDPTSLLDFVLPDEIKQTKEFKNRFGENFEGLIKEGMNSIGLTRQDKTAVQTVLERADEGKISGYRGGKNDWSELNADNISKLMIGMGAGGLSPLGRMGYDIVKSQMSKPKINPKNYKDSRKPGRSKMPGVGTLMIDSGDGSSQTTIGPETNRISKDLSKKFGQFPMGSFKPEAEPIPEISAKQPSKFETVKNIFRSKQEVGPELNKNPVFQGLTEEQTHNAQVRALESLMTEAYTKPGYDPYRDYDNVAKYKRQIDDLEGGQHAVYGDFVPGKGFQKTKGFLGRYEKTRREQMSKGFNTKDDRVNQQRNTGYIDSGFQKGYAEWKGGKLSPEAQVTSRNYNAETGMIMNQTNDGMVGLESSVRQEEKKIFMDQASKRYAEDARQRRLKKAEIASAKPNLPGQKANATFYKEGTDRGLTKEDMESGRKTAKDLMVGYLNQKGKDKYGKTGFQNLQANNRINAPNVAAPTLQGPEFLKDNLPMYGQNLQAPLLFGTKQQTNPMKSLESQDYIAGTSSFDNTKGYDLNTRTNQEKTNTPFAQYNNPQEYMPPKDFFQPKTMLENQMVQAQGLTSIPMGSAMMNQMVQAQGLTSIPMGSAMMNQSSASIPMGSTMMNQMVKAQGLTSIPMGSAMMNQSSTSPFGERNMISDALGKNLDSDNSFMFSNNTRDPKTNLAVSPTNPKLQMQEEPKEKNKDKEASKQTEDISKSFGTLKEQLNEFSEIIKSTGETLEKTFKDKSQDKSQQQNQQKDKQVEEVKFNEIKANVTVNSTPDTKTEAAIAAIEKVINELRSQMDQLKSKVTNQVNPPSVKRN
jgi:TP901 family phage tail tape measure protein